MTRRASLLGTVSFCGNAPILFLGLVGGAIADRASRRAIMLGALGVIAATALTLAVLTASGHIAVWHIIAISMVAGTASALFAPAMQAVIPSLVEPGELLNAISLNSVQFNLARTIGPALAGFAYGTIGPQGCFALNAAGFLVMILMLARVRLPRRPPGAPPPVGRALRDGLGYARRHPAPRGRRHARAGGEHDDRDSLRLRDGGRADDRLPRRPDRRAAGARGRRGDHRAGRERRPRARAGPGGRSAGSSGVGPGRAPG